MNDPEKLIPPPSLVRDRLARNIRERRLLRAQLRVSVNAAEVIRQQAGGDPRPETAERGDRHEG